MHISRTAPRADGVPESTSPQHQLPLSRLWSIMCGLNTFQNVTGHCQSSASGSVVSVAARELQSVKGCRRV